MTNNIKLTEENFRMKADSTDGKVTLFFVFGRHGRTVYVETKNLSNQYYNVEAEIASQLRNPYVKGAVFEIDFGIRDCLMFSQLKKAETLFEALTDHRLTNIENQINAKLNVDRS